MNKQTIWLAISYFAVASLFLVSCASAVTDEGEKVTREEAAEQERDEEVVAVEEETPVEETEVAPTSTPTPPQLPMKGVELPREVERAGGSTSTTTVRKERNIYGGLTGLHLTETYTRDCGGSFPCTRVTDIIFRGSGGGEPAEKTVTFTYPADIDESIPTDRPYPVFSPIQIVTEYVYEHPEKPLNSEYQGSASYVVIENLGTAGDIAVTVKDCSIVFHMEKGERVRVSAHLNEPRPNYSRSPLGEIEWYSPYTWVARPALPGDVSQGEVNLERLG